MEEVQQWLHGFGFEVYREDLRVEGPWLLVTWDMEHIPGLESCCRPIHSSLVELVET
ncbi:MAG: hypothetical protein HY093_02000 [Candidatus Liptonbacteria bacterium]|nr:hypothetical protein [Candidatus Liptonbacteria bacterium]